MTALHQSLDGGPVVTYDDSGGDGFPIIFSHGLFMNRSMFKPQIDHFRAGYRCITWDERSHGGTRWDSDFTYWDSARDLLDLMDALGIDQALHVGMSQGGLLGMRAALLQPDRFVGLVQLSSQAGKLDEEAAAGFRSIMDEWIEKGINQDIIDFLDSLILGPGTDNAYWHDYWSKLEPSQIRAALSALYSIDVLYDRLGEIRTPLCTIHGLADQSTPYALAERVALGVPHPCGITLVPDGPHAVNLSHPGAVNAAISEFIEALKIGDDQSEDRI